MSNILDQFPELREKCIDETTYNFIITDVTLYHRPVEKIARAFALSQRRSEIRRYRKRRWWQRRRS